MNSLEDKKILCLGAGNMGKECLKSMFAEQNHINPANVTIICGTSEGKNKAAITALLDSIGVDSSQINLFSRDEVSHQDFTPETHYDVVMSGIKPHLVESAFAPFRDAISKETDIISMVAGLDEKDYHHLTHTEAKVVETMPHMPRALYGLYSDHAESKAIAKQLFCQMGEAVEVESSAQMSGYTSAGGTGPGVIAHYVAQFDGEEKQQQAMKWLTALASGQSKPEGSLSVTSKLVGEKCSHFYKGFMAASRSFLGEDNGTLVTNKSIMLTIDTMQKSPLSANEYAAAVRSAKGTTNAAIMTLGGEPPNNPKFGNPEQLAQQCAYAKKCSLKKDGIGSVIAALVAAKNRCAKLSENLGDPMHNVEYDAIMHEADLIGQAISERYP